MPELSSFLHRYRAHPGQSESSESGSSPAGLNRRQFMARSGAFALGVSLLLSGGGLARAESLAGTKRAPDLFISIEPDGTTRLVCHRSEMGQHVWTSIAQLLAEELEADWDSVVIEQAEGHPRYGDQNTDGSRSIRYNFDRLRVVGAAMRLMIERAAGQEWDVRSEECVAFKGKVTHDASGNSATFGELAAKAAEQPVPDSEEVVLKKRDEWRLINHDVPSLTVPSIIRGEGTFGHDLFKEGMKVAVIARPPRLFDTLESVDDKDALAVAGVEKVVQLPVVEPPAAFKPLGGVAVIAKDTWSAIQGRKALKLEWKPGPNAGYNSDEFEQQLMETIRKPGQAHLDKGNVSEALDNAAQKIEAEYYVPHLAHASMEPPAALAFWDGDTVECHGCTQTPQASRSTIASVCGVPEENVKTVPSWLGGGFGRKSKPDYMAEAALLAREVGAPVKVIWTREDDLQHDYLHTVSAQRFEGALNKKGECIGVLHRTAFPPISSTFRPGADAPSSGELRMGANDTPWDVPNYRVETRKANAHVRTGWLRSVANIYHAFGVQSFMGELAHAAGKDQKDFLLELIGEPRNVNPNDHGADYDNYGSPLKDYPIDTGRLAHCVKRVAELSGWGRQLPDGHGLGIAAHRSFVTYVATVIEVAVDKSGRLTIPGVWSVMDAGTVVNPNHCKAQMEGGTLFGLSCALYGEMTAKDGIVQQTNFPHFRVMRMNEAPRKMEVEIVPSDGPPGGVGEPPTPPAAPALTNAIFAATGVRIRRLPIFGTNRRDRISLQEAS